MSTLGKRAVMNLFCHALTSSLPWEMGTTYRSLDQPCIQTITDDYMDIAQPDRALGSSTYYYGPSVIRDKWYTCKYIHTYTHFSHSCGLGVPHGYKVPRKPHMLATVLAALILLSPVLLFAGLGSQSKAWKHATNAGGPI